MSSGRSDCARPQGGELQRGLPRTTGAPSLPCAPHPMWTRPSESRKHRLRRESVLRILERRGSGPRRNGRSHLARSGAGWEPGRTARRRNPSCEVRANVSGSMGRKGAETLRKSPGRLWNSASAARSAAVFRGPKDRQPESAAQSQPETPEKPARHRLLRVFSPAPRRLCGYMDSRSEVKPR
jgi:hypothetical protein